MVQVLVHRLLPLHAPQRPTKDGYVVLGEGICHVIEDGGRGRGGCYDIMEEGSFIM